MYSNKHAFLIMAHNQFDILKKTIQLLDHERIDFFIHIDKKSKNVDLLDINRCAIKSKIYFIDRKNIYWGGYSQIDGTLRLIKEAIGRKQYQYYHFLSGCDMPLRNVNYILDFFDKNVGTEFVHFDSLSPCDEVMLRRIKYYRIGRIDKQSSFIKGLLALQKALKINRLDHCNINFYKGSLWFSISNDFATYLLKQKSFIIKHFKFCANADELFIQTIICNSSFFEKTYFKKMNMQKSNCFSNLRYIVWINSESYKSPHVFRENDFNEIIASGCLYARKFDTNIDRNIVDKIYNYVKTDASSYV